MTAALASGFTGDLVGAPNGYATPAVRPSLADAQAWCRHLAETHYENFHVATFFLPKRLKPHFESIYAYCRVSDDLGDEVADPALALKLLEEWRAMLDECFAVPEQSRHPVYVALAETIRLCDLPKEPFAALLRAFVQDQTKTRYESLAELDAYSEDSANPVGRLVLYASGYRDEAMCVLSDHICTALQLANFWQDVVEDWERGRRYLPADQMTRFGVTDEQVAARRFDENFRALMESLVSDARGRLHQGAALPGMVDAELAATLELFAKGGHAILDAIVAQGYDVLRARPVVSKTKKMALLCGALTGKLRAALQGGAR